MASFFGHLHCAYLLYVSAKHLWWKMLKLCLYTMYWCSVVSTSNSIYMYGVHSTHVSKYVYFSYEVDCRLMCRVVTESWRDRRQCAQWSTTTVAWRYNGCSVCRCDWTYCWWLPDTLYVTLCPSSFLCGLQEVHRIWVLCTVEVC